MEVSYTLHKFFNDDMLEELGGDEIKEKVNNSKLDSLNTRFL
jgi:hypothetical protein